MKKQLSKEISSKDIASLKTKSAKVLLIPVLSPLEQIALNKKWKPFIFKIEQTKIYVSAFDCKQLLVSTINKLRLLNGAVQRTRESEGIPMRVRETFYDPKIILSLQPILRNKLCSLECYTLFAVKLKGRSYFEKQKVSASGIKTIESLFKKYKCSHLFK